MKRFLTAVLLVAWLAVPAAAQQKQGLQVEDLFTIKRVGDPQISPDGRSVAYVVTTTDKARNSRSNQIWLVPAAGGAPRQLTSTGSNDRPRWSPDGRWLAFTSTRDQEYARCERRVLLAASPLGHLSVDRPRFDDREAGGPQALD